MDPFELKTLRGFSGFDAAFDFSSLPALTDFSAVETMEECVQTDLRHCRKALFHVFRDDGLQA